MKNINDLYISAIIVAAGSGKRMNMDINKQYIEVGGVPILAQTLRVFEICDLIKEIVVVVKSEELLLCKNNIIDKYRYKKVKTLIGGGKERQDSVRNGLLEVNKNSDIVVIHDGARPFIEAEILQDTIIEANKYGASTVAVPVKDTIKIVDAKGISDKTLDRNYLWAAQTPQAFRYDILRKAHTKASEDGFFGTDDTALVERIGEGVKLVMGSYENIKITTREDIILAEAIVARKWN